MAYLQVQTAYRCAVHLRDLISPHMIRRIKKDVLQQLPSKKEQVLFCRLCNHQVQLYQEYLASAEVRAIPQSDFSRSLGAAVD